MRARDLLDIIGEIADEHIRDANKKRLPRWMGWASGVVACLVLVLGCLALLPREPSILPDADTTSPAAAGGSGHTEGTVFMSYAGPVFPLSVQEDSGLEALRHVVFDFESYQDEAVATEVWENNGKGIVIHDTYSLHNHAQEQKTVTAIYPVAGDFQTMQWPVVTVNGTEVAWELFAGVYAGTFRGAGDERSSSLNLEYITSWEGYRDLLSDGSYAAQAFVEAEALSQPVVVYALTDLTDGGNGYSTAIGMRYQCDPARTQILTMGFNGASIDEETGEECRSFFVREGLRKPDEETKYLIVIGDDLGEYTIQGYENAKCEHGEEVEGASATVTRKETTMGEILREIAYARFSAISGSTFDGDHNRYLNERISFELYYQAVMKHFAVYGPMGTEPKERYELGMLDDIVNEVAHHNRVFYLQFEITIPAGENVELYIAQYKPASFDFHCSGSENVGIDGYDMVTSLGSNLDFSEQRATISHYEAIEIVRQNFGFDLANGVTEVALAPSEPHYYLEVRAPASAAE